ncbi:MAG: methyl-accepting chemotaxis protein [Sulfuritalea sp.]|nr:methyl-accepting chemotaxis protein [Sulfuritalea sp.]
MNNLSIGFRIGILMCVSGLLLVSIAAVGWFNGNASVASLKSVYEDRAVPLKDLARIQELLSENTKELMLASQHDPSSVLASVHEHPVKLHVDLFMKRKAEITQLWDKFSATVNDDGEKKLAADFDEKNKKWVKIASGLMERMSYEEFGPEILKEILVAERSVSAPAMKSLVKLLELQSRIAGEEFNEAKSRHQRGTGTYLILILAGLVGSAAFGLFLTRSITRPLLVSVATAESIAAGDLRGEIPPGGSDEAGRLLKALTKMQGNLRTMISTTKISAESISTAAQALSTAVDHAAQASDKQSASASDMAAAIEEMSVSIDLVRDHAREARDIAVQSGEESLTGGKIIHSTTDEMHQVENAVNLAAGTIRELEAYSSEISTIIKVIRDVADQTNMLALNAAIEAARAGEQGRGFAVVADEVRKLAERTAESTHTITTVIGKVQEGARRAATEMEGGVARVASGVEQARQAGASINGIQDGASRVASAVGDIRSALDEQSTTTQAIARSVETIAQMAEENSATVRQNATEADHLRSLAADLNNAISRFQL